MPGLRLFTALYHCQQGDSIDKIHLLYNWEKKKLGNFFSFKMRGSGQDDLQGSSELCNAEYKSP